MQATTPAAPKVEAESSGAQSAAPATKPPIAMGAALQSAISGLDRAHLKHSGPPRVRYLSAAELSGAAVREKGWRTFADYMVFGTADGGDGNANGSSGKTEAAEDVAFSARYVAAVRAIESELPATTRLFDDPYAHVLAGASAVSAVKRAMKARSVATAAQSKPKPAAAPASAAADDSDVEEEYWCAQRPFLIIRTRFIDDFVRTALSATAFTQVVILGSGMDTRAYRLPWPSGTHVFELDRPSVVAWKAAQLTAAAVDLRSSGVAVHSAGVDLTDPAWVTALTALPFDPTRPTLWIVEGLLYYFSPAHVTALLANITSLSAAGSRLVADVVNEAERAAVSFRSAVAHPHVLTDAKAGDLKGWRLLVPPQSPVAATPNGEGTDVVQPGDMWCANHGRWTRPFPPLPPGVAGDGVRRAFFVSAVKL